MSSSASQRTTQGEGNQEDFAPEQSRGFQVLGFRNYRLFFVGQLISTTGMWMQSLAQSWLLVQDLDATPLQLGLLPIAQFGPTFLLSIPMGSVIDKYERKQILAITQTFFLIFASIMAWLVWTGRIELWHVFVLAVAMGVTSAFDMPTRQAFVAELVPKHALQNAIALNSAVFNTGRVLGPAIAGVILGQYGAAVCFAANAVSYLGPILALALMKLKKMAVRAVGSAKESMMEGITFVRSSPNIMRPIMLVATVGTFGMAYNVWLPLLATQSFNASEAQYGYMFTAMGIGSLAGALSVAFSRGEVNPLRMLTFGAILGIVIVGIATVATIPLNMWLAILGLAFSGFSAANAMAIANTIVQTTAPDELRGRIMSVYTTVFLGSAPIGGLIAGAISQRWGVEMSMFVGGIIVTTVALYLFTKLRQLRAATAHAAAS